MGQVLHGCATTTEAVRRAIQNSQESLRALAKRYGINQKTVAKWKRRETVADRSTGPKEATVLSIEEEAIRVLGAVGIGNGEFTVAGQSQAYFGDASVYSQILNNTQVSYDMRLGS